MPLPARLRVVGRNKVARHPSFVICQWSKRTRVQEYRGTKKVENEQAAV